MINLENKEVSSSNKMLGEFFTPSNVVKSFHKLMVDTLGDIYNDYVVWDPAWGIGNLTKGYAFKSLFCSTLRAVDLKRGRLNNKGAEKFVYDFLNDDVEPLMSLQNRLTHEYKMPEELLDAFENNKKILFLMNPPYAGTGNFGGQDSGSKVGATQNGLRDLMSQDKCGLSTDNLYTQFMYRIMLMKKVYNLTNISIAIICPPQYLSVKSYSTFREKLFDEFEFKGAKLIQASNFDSLSGNWGISLSVWKNGKTTERNKFLHEVIEYDSDGSEVKIEDKYIYNLDNKVRACDWVRGLIKDNTKVCTPVYSSGCMTKDKPMRGIKDAIAYCGNKANNVYHNQTEVVMVTGCYSDGCGIPITRDNIVEECMYFSARKAIIGKYSNWINDKDEYSKPDFDSTDVGVKEAIEILKNNSIVYTIFNNSCHVSSMKNVPYIDSDSGQREYKRMTNELFWLTKDNVRSIHERLGLEINDEMFTQDTERYMPGVLYKTLNSGCLLPEAMRILRYANELYSKTLIYREEFKANNNYGIDDFQVNNWDCGWYQIKQLVKEHMEDDWKAFNKMYSKFTDSLVPYIYKSGMLL